MFSLVRDIKHSEKTQYNESKYFDVYWSCKGRCDQILENKYFQNGGITEWNDISDIVMPKEFLRWNIAMNNIRIGEIIFTDEAYEKLKDFIIKVSQMVLREQSEEEIKRYKDLREIPPWL